MMGTEQYYYPKNLLGVITLPFSIKFAYVESCCPYGFQIMLSWVMTFCELIQLMQFYLHCYACPQKSWLNGEGEKKQTITQGKRVYKCVGEAISQTVSAIKM